MINPCFICGEDTGSPYLRFCGAHMEIAVLADAVWHGRVTDWPAWAGTVRHDDVMCEVVPLPRGSWLQDVTDILIRKGWRE